MFDKLVMSVTPFLPPERLATGGCDAISGRKQHKTNKKLGGDVYGRRI